MRKKGRGLARRKRAVKKKCATLVCPFWVFVLFISAWFAVAFVAIAFFYSAVRWPTHRMIPYVPSERGNASLGAGNVPDEISDLPSEAREPGLPSSESSLSIESCRSLEDVEDVYQMVLERVRDYSVSIRQYGVWCRLTDGTEYVTYTINQRVPESERLYLEQVLSRVYRSDSESFVAPIESFYCRTSPRGRPAEIVNAKDGGVELRCTYQEGGKEIDRYLSLDKSGIRGDSTDDVRSNINTRAGTGDFARDYCVMRKDGNLCLLRNGDWLLASIDHAKGDELLVKRSEDPSELVGSEFHFLNHALKVIGTEGSYADVYYGWATERSAEISIIRVDLRTGEQNELFHFIERPIN